MAHFEKLSFEQPLGLHPNDGKNKLNFQMQNFMLNLFEKKNH